MEDKLRNEMVVFFTKFYVMIANGVDIYKTLRNLENETENPDLKIASANLLKFDTAHPLFEIMSKYPDLFDATIIKFIKVGEETGCLDLQLKIIPEYLLFSKLPLWEK